MTESRLGGWWRAAATGLCFLAYWLLCLVAAPTVLLLLLISTRDPALRVRRVRKLVSLSFRWLLAWSKALGIGHFEIEGEEWLAATAGRLVVANHPSFLDVAALLSRLPNANCVVKRALRRHPLLAPFVCACGYIANDAEPPVFLAACRAAKARGEALVMFPEGTRTAADAPLSFRRGAAQIALRAGMEILPVTVRCDPPLLSKERHWYQGPRRRVRHLVKFHAPLRAETLAPVTGVEPPIAARRLTRGLQSYFQKELASP
ncbi:MAG: lysophospholipid acyltransferase family protein [Gammaproteobacteria bacterium]